MKSLFNSSKLRALSVLAVHLLLLSSSQANLDVNANNLSDFWEKQYNNGNLFPNTFLTTADPDQDGWNNLTESYTGTDPFSSTSPNGFVTTDLIRSLTYGAYTLEWPTKIGKVYQVQYSQNLTNWSNLGDPIIATTTSHSIGVHATQPDTTVPPKLFWRVTITDVDTDGDGLTDAEESVIGTNPQEKNSLLGIHDHWLGKYFTDTLMQSGLNNIDLSDDQDNDGSTVAEEYLNGTDPHQADAPSKQQWIILHGDEEENIEKQRSKTQMIPAGESAILMIAVASDEYPYYTDPETTDDFDDTIRWNITIENNPSITEQIHVNDYHIDWIVADVNQQFLPTISSPVHYKLVQVITAPSDQDLTITIEIAATNIGDGALPSHIACGLLPDQVIIPEIDEQGEEIDGEYLVAKSLKVAKWENAFTGNTYASGAVIDDFISYNPDRFYVKVGNGAQIGISSVDVETTDHAITAYNNNADEIELRAMEDNAAVISDSIILVSNDHDDDYSASGAGNDDEKNDRTHRTQLGGNLRVSAITINGVKHQINFKLPVPVRKVLEVDFIRMNVAGVPQLTAIQDSVKFMNEYYAQVGLKITGVPKEIAWPVWPGRPEGYIDPFDEPEGRFVGPLTAEYKNFIDETDSDGINLYYIKIANLNVMAIGLAITSRQLLLEEGLDMKYTKKAFIFQNTSLTGSTTAHELLHILAHDPDKEEDHQQKFFNLLAVENNSSTPVMWRKRMDLKQEQFIYLDPNVQNP